MTTRKALIQDIENQFLKLSHILKAVHSTPYDYGCGELLYPAEIHTLDCIGSNPDITVTELAERMGVTKGAISQIKSKLFKKKLLLKRNFANDQKKIALALSKKGKIACQGHKKFHEYMSSKVEKSIRPITKEQLIEYHHINQLILDMLKDTDNLKPV